MQAACGGQANVSDAFAAAVWVVDWAAEMSKRGVARVNLHGVGSHSSYSPVALRTCDANDDDLEVKPLFYGMRFFNELVAGARPAWLGKVT